MNNKTNHYQFPLLDEENPELNHFVYRADMVGIAEYLKTIIRNEDLEHDKIIGDVGNITATEYQKLSADNSIMREDESDEQQLRDLLFIKRKNL